MKIIVSRNELLAALLFASDDEARFTLSSVCVEVSPGRKPTLIATDGRRLAVIESQAEQAQEFDAQFQMLLRADFLRPICALSRAFGGKLFPWIEFESFPGSQRCVVTFIGGKCFFEAHENALVEGAFPNWRQCIPAKDLVRSQMNDLGINAVYVSDFVRAGKVLNAQTPMIQMNLVGEDAAIEVKIPGVEYFYALVMPCKVDKTVDYQPEFLGIVTDLPVKVPAAPANEGEPNSTRRRGDAEGAKDPENQEKPKTEHEVMEGDGADEDEELIQQCIEVIRSEQKASIALLQRRLRLGYRQANKIMHELEHRGIVGPSKGAEPRDILIDAVPA